MVRRVAHRLAGFAVAIGVSLLLTVAVAGCGGASEYLDSGEHGVPLLYSHQNPDPWKPHTFSGPVYFGAWAWWEAEWEQLSYRGPGSSLGDASAEDIFVERYGNPRPQPCEHPLTLPERSREADVVEAAPDMPVVRLGHYYHSGRSRNFVMLNICLADGPVPATDLEIGLEVFETDPPSLDTDTTPTTVTLPAGQRVATVALPLDPDHVYRTFFFHNHVYFGNSQPLAIRIVDGSGYAAHAGAVEIEAYRGAIQGGNGGYYPWNAVTIEYSKEISEDAADIRLLIQEDLAAAGLHLGVDDIEFVNMWESPTRYSYHLHLHPAFPFTAPELAIELNRIKRVLRASPPIRLLFVPRG